jgi:hypothetical protein
MIPNTHAWRRPQASLSSRWQRLVYRYGCRAGRSMGPEPPPTSRGRKPDWVRCASARCWAAAQLVLSILAQVDVRLHVALSTPVFAAPLTGSLKRTGSLPGPLARRPRSSHLLTGVSIHKAACSPLKHPQGRPSQETAPSKEAACQQPAPFLPSSEPRPPRYTSDHAFWHHLRRGRPPRHARTRLIVCAIQNPACVCWKASI